MKTTGKLGLRLLVVGLAVALILVAALPVLGRQRAYGSSRVDYCDYEGGLSSAYDTNGEKYGWAVTTGYIFCSGVDGRLRWLRGLKIYTQAGSDSSYSGGFWLNLNTGVTIYDDRLDYSDHNATSNLGTRRGFRLFCCCTDA